MILVNSKGVCFTTAYTGVKNKKTKTSGHSTAGNSESGPEQQLRYA